MSIKLAIVGGRTFNNYESFKLIVGDHIKTIGDPELIISGGAIGVDTMAERYANEHNIKLLIFKPDWSTGKGAGLSRNTDIIRESTHVIALPTKESRGTYDSINKAKLYKKHLTVVNV